VCVLDLFAISADAGEPAGRGGPLEDGERPVTATLTDWMPTTTGSTRPWSWTAALVERAQAGDREAFGALVEHFQPTVYAICRARLGHSGEAAELTQEVFLHAMRRLGQLRQPERFAGWIKQVAVRMAINRATRRVPPPSVDRELLESTAGPRAEPLGELIARERARLLWDGLARLAPMDRETLVAFYIQGLSIVEVAALHDAPVGTIKRRLHTARKRLKAILQADHGDWDDELEDADDADIAEPELELATA
jgi:RNA polymerase sigma-70 factor (ECF subfamily)